MYIKIYFDNKPLFLCNEIDEEIQPYAHHDDAVLIDELNARTVKTMIHEMNQEHVHAGIFLHPDLEELKKIFFKRFELIRAAGGLVVNEKKEILMIFRKGKWDLPKGKLDGSEKLENCALREVEEETGLTGAKLEDFLITTYHVYHEGTKAILKESHWFAMTAKKDQQFTPQEEEGITDIQWADKKSIEKYLQNAYPLTRDVVEEARKKGYF